MVMGFIYVLHLPEICCIGSRSVPKAIVNDKHHLEHQGLIVGFCFSTQPTQVKVFVANTKGIDLK
jgi:hypothetical protein